MSRVKRRNTQLVASPEIVYRDAHGFRIGIGYGVTNRGHGILAFTVRSKIEGRNNKELASTVLVGRIGEAVRQMRGESAPTRKGRVRVKLTTLIPARSLEVSEGRDG